MAAKLKVGVIDDEEAILNKFRELIGQFDDYCLGFACADPLEGFSRASNREVDVLITDVMMPNLGGLAISERLKDSGIPIILCSAKDSYGASAFQLDLVYFLSKPPVFDQLSIALKKARERLEFNSGSGDPNFADFRIINSNGGLTGELLYIPDIDYLEQSGNYTNIHLGRNRKVIVSTLSAALENLKGKGILRIHRSYAVNIAKIHKIMYTKLELKNGTLLPLGPIYTSPLETMLRFKKL